MESIRAMDGLFQSYDHRFLKVIGLLPLLLGILAFYPLGPLNSPPPITPVIAPPPPVRTERLLASYGKLPLSFEANQGQTGKAVKFLARGKGYALFLTGDEAVLSLRSRASAAPAKRSLRVSTSGARGTAGLVKSPTVGPVDSGGEISVAKPPRDGGPQTASDVLRVRLAGANANAPVIGEEELPGKSNYFIGNDPKKWRTDVPTYARVKYKDIYPGVDLVYYGNQVGNLEYDLIVTPGADPSAIRFALSGQREDSSRQSAVGSGQSAGQFKIQNSKFKIDSDGDLVMNTDRGEVLFHKPVIYQEQLIVDSPRLTAQARRGNTTANPKSKIQNRKFVEGKYILEANNQVGFKVAAYDHTRPLIVDPVLTYSTYLGGSSDDSAYAIAVDSAGDAYIAGPTSSTNFPTKGPYQASYRGSTDAFVAKLNPAGSALVYSTFVGGSDEDVFGAIALDSSDEAVLAGSTESNNFPILHALTGGASFATGGFESMVVKLNAAGNGLIYSTYLGGTGDGYANAVALDSSGDAYVGGYTNSLAFPMLKAILGSNPGGYTGTVSRLHWDTSTTALSLVYSTYWGGNGATSVNGLAADNAGNVYMGGNTSATNLVTLNPFQAANAGGTDGFVARLNWNGTSLTTGYSTYIGGSGNDSVEGLTIDNGNHAFVTGYTSSSNFPTAHPWQAAIGGQTDAFVAEIKDAGEGLVFSTFLGGSAYEQGNKIVLGSTGNVYVAGYTASSNFPTANAVQHTIGGGEDAFVTALYWSGSTISMRYSTFLGGSENDGFHSLVVDSSGNVYAAGYTVSTNFPTASPLQHASGGDYDAVVAKISEPSGPVVGFSSPNLTFSTLATGSTSAAQTETFTNLGTSSLTISSVARAGADPGDFTISAETCTASAIAPKGTCTVSVEFTPVSTGSLSASLELTDDASGSPHTLALFGTGKTGTQPVAGVSATSLTFASLNLGLTSASQAVTLKNTGSDTLSITSIAISTNFSETNTCAGSVAGGGSCTINVSFAPKATGSLTGSLTITDNSKGVAGTTQSVGLTGTGLAAIVVTLTPASKSLVLGGTQVFTATISNTTNTGLNWYVNGVLNGNSTQGTLTGSGLTRTYTAPPVDVPSPNPAVIKVASAAAATVYKTAAVTVTDSIAVTLSPATKTLALGGTQVFTATISGSTNTALSWYVNGVLNGNSAQGTLTGSGMTRTYTAPASAVPSTNPVVIKVASAADPAKSKTASVTVTSP